ncbi:protein NRT1/ PTR FAMILY 5.10-like [Humulus lupulus]|uniref:protein NRT1/ PTR FAMILY 5.10-like n=1 Tax=Humulus lupulus TaxID=3486 RepID=UPI002B4118E1|nr:protein NRT1/ PTR FAMILY 5.10-like [Humulus lupulus]
MKISNHPPWLSTKKNNYTNLRVESLSLIMADDAETPMLLVRAVDGAVDYKGHPASRSNTGRWRSASFIIGVEIAERFAYYGISSNLVTYLTGPLGQSTAAAAANINAWCGTALLLPLLGASVADSFLGRYRTISMASLLYILGLGLLTFSAVLPSLMDGFDSQTNMVTTALFFFSLYLIAVAEGGHRPCAQAFGADQFDGQDPEECKSKSSFFNWWYFGVSAGATVTVMILSYIQDNLSWVLGFGIPCIAMIIALVVFLAGTKTYRYSIGKNEKGPFVRISSVFVAAFRNRQKTSPLDCHGFLSEQNYEQFKFLNKAMVVCSIAEIEETKAVLRLVPIWSTCLVYGIVCAQISTLYIKQGATMDRTVVSGFEIPPASLQCFMGITILVILPMYDRIFVPIAKSLTTNPSGITMLQRIGTGILLSAISTIVAALVEMKRLKIAKEYDLVDKPSVTVPMSVWRLVPQYLIFGLADVFTLVGLQEFFYEQVPQELRSIGLALYLSVTGIGNFLSGIVISVIDNATGGDGRDSWFSNNLNRAHLDYFYWLISGLSLIGFVTFLHFSKSYIYNRNVF